MVPCNIPLSAVHFLFLCPSPREIKWQVTNVSRVGGDLGHKKDMHTRAWASLPSSRAADEAREWGSYLAGWAWVRPTAMLSGSSLQQGGVLAPHPLVWLGAKCRYTGSFGWSVNLRDTSTYWNAIAPAIPVFTGFTLRLSCHSHYFQAFSSIGETGPGESGFKHSPKSQPFHEGISGLRYSIHFPYN